MWLVGTFRLPGASRALRRECIMYLPKIDIAQLPDLDVQTGAFGTMSPIALGSDQIIIVGTYIYETIPPGG
jgi:hypothetical protein